MAKKKAKDISATAGAQQIGTPVLNDDVASKLLQQVATETTAVTVADEPQIGKSDTSKVKDLKIDSNLDVTWDTSSHDIFVVTVTKENGDMICEPFEVTPVLFRISKNKSIWDSVRNCGYGKYILHMNGQKNGKWNSEWSKAEFTYKTKTVNFPSPPTMKKNQPTTPPPTTSVPKVQNITASKESFSWKAGDHDKYELKVVTVLNAPVGGPTETTKSRYDVVDQLKKVNAGAGSYFFQIRGFKNNTWSEWTSRSFDYKPIMNSSPASQTPASQTPASQTPASQTPASQTPASQTPASQTPASQTPASQTPASQTPASQTPASQTPASQTPASQTPASQTPASQTPASTARKWWLRWLPPVLEPVVIIIVIAALSFAGYTAIKKMGWLDSKSTSNDNVAELLEKIIIQSNLLSKLANPEMVVASGDRGTEKIIGHVPVAVGKATSDMSNHGLRISADRNGFVYQAITIVQGNTNIVQKVGQGDPTGESENKLPEGVPDHPEIDIDMSKNLGMPPIGSTTTLFSSEIHVARGNGVRIHIPTEGWDTELLCWSTAEDIHRWVNVRSRENPDWRNIQSGESQHAGEPNTLIRRGVSYWVKIKENSKLSSVKIQMKFSPSQYRP